MELSFQTSVGLGEFIIWTAGYLAGDRQAFQTALSKLALALCVQVQTHSKRFQTYSIGKAKF
jgi:hypothetical protein